MARAARLIPAAATKFSPYILVYKQKPQLSMPSALGEYSVDDLADLTSEQVCELTSNFKLLAEEI